MTTPIPGGLPGLPLVHNFDAHPCADLEKWAPELLEEYDAAMAAAGAATIAREALAEAIPTRPRPPGRHRLEAVAKAEKAVARKIAVKRNRFITLAGGTKTVNRELEAKPRGLAGLKSRVARGIGDQVCPVRLRTTLRRALHGMH